jgi:integrase
LKKNTQKFNNHFSFYEDIEVNGSTVLIYLQNIHYTCVFCGYTDGAFFVDLYPWIQVILIISSYGYYQGHIKNKERGNSFMQNQDPIQLSLFDVNFQEAGLANCVDELFTKSNLIQPEEGMEGLENGDAIINKTLLNDALQLNTSKIFMSRKYGNNFLAFDEFGRTRQSIDRVKKLLSNECIKLVNVAEYKNSKNANVVEELITILNNTFNQPTGVLSEDSFKRLINLGVKGQKEFLLTKYLSNVESRTLRDFIKQKKQYAPESLIKLISRIAEFENLVSRKLNKEPSELSEFELADRGIMEGLVTSDFFAKQFSQLHDYLDESKTFEFIHQPKVVQKLNHPIVNLYAKDLQRRNRSAARIEKMERQIKSFFKWLPTLREFQGSSINEISVWEITREHLVEYKAYLIRQSKLGVFTKYNCKQRLKDTKTFFKRIYELNLISENIALTVSNIQASDYFYRKLPDDADMEELFKAIEIYSEEPDKDTLAFALISFLGFRIIELYRLRWEDINLSTKTIAVQSKGNKSHTLPISDVIYKMLNKISFEDREGFLFRKSNDEKEKTFKSRIENAFTLYKIFADWDLDGGPHLLRHWYITSLARQNVEPVDVRTLARHDSLKTTSKYIHYYSSELKEAINKIDYEVSYERA